MKNILLLAVMLFLFSCQDDAGFGIRNDSDIGSSGNTLNGSYANIIEVDDYLYAINRSELHTFEVTEQGVDKVNEQEVGFDIENIYYTEGVLFIGSRTSLHIFKINDQKIPERKSETAYFEFAEEIRPCDPVISRNNLAYVTLSTSTTGECNRNIPINELRIYNVEDISNPKLLSITEMTNPKGLGFKDNYLIVGEADHGITIIDIKDSYQPVIVNNIDGFNAYDLIVNGNKLLVVGKDAIRQFDITDVNDIQLYSKIDL